MIRGSLRYRVSTGFDFNIAPWLTQIPYKDLVKREWELRSESLHPGQTRTRVAWELRSESLHESFLNSHAPVKREQELHESWELRSESLHESFLNSHAPVKREQELHESWWEARVCILVKREQELHESWEARVCMRVFSTLMPRSNENKSCMRVDEKREFAWEFSQLSCTGQTRTRFVWELMRVEKREFAQEVSQLSCSCQMRTRVFFSNEKTLLQLAP